MKRMIILAALCPLMFACSPVQHREPSWQPHPSVLSKLYRCTVNNQRGMTWTRTGADRSEACHRAMLACRHYLGDIRQHHRPNTCQRVHQEGI